MPIQPKEAVFIQNIYDITRGNLENAKFPFPHLQRVIKHMTCVRIARLSRFWEEHEGKRRISLEQSVEDLITGLYGEKTPWIFLIKGCSSHIECWFGVPQKTANHTSLMATLCGAFPDLRFDKGAGFDPSAFKSLKHAFTLTGVPSSQATKRQNEKLQSEHIEKLCRGIYGLSWIYSVYAEPVDSGEIITRTHDLFAVIQETQKSLLKTKSIEKSRFAQHYLKLLETQYKRLEQARIVGMWNTDVTILLENASLAGRAQALLRSAFSGDQSSPVPIRTGGCDSTVTSQPPDIEPLNSREVAVLARPPQEEYAGYGLVEYIRFGVESNISIAPGALSVDLGDIVDRGSKTGQKLQIPLADLTKHGLIVGVTGSGKTNTCFSLLEQLRSKANNVPFLVIESAKSEYRALIKNAQFRDLNIFTVGDDAISPLRLNPFEVPQGFSIQTHIDYLKSLFSAAFVLYPPMPYVLEQSIQEVYEDLGWDLALNANWRGYQSERIFPTLSDLIVKVDDVVQRMGYDERITMDVKAGLVARLHQLRIGGGKGLMFNTRRSISPKILFESPCLLELKQLVSDDEKAFLIGLILIRLYEHYESGAASRAGVLNHITLIEEAHRLLQNVSSEQGSDIVANPKGRAIEVFVNILSEIRAYGEGIFIAEQVPSKLTPDAIKNTNLKIIHRLVADDDRKLVGSTMNLSEPQLRFLTTLRPNDGEAAAYTEGMQKPVLVTIGLSKSKTVQHSVSPQELSKHTAAFWRSPKHREILTIFSGCPQCPVGLGKPECDLGRNQPVSQLLAGSFTRLFNALRFGSKEIPRAYTDFLDHHKNQRSRSGKAVPPFCTYMELLEKEMTQRGNFWGWQHVDIDKVLDYLYIIGKHLSQNALDAGFSQAIGSLVQLNGQLHQTVERPYLGCCACLATCQYRFDMNVPEGQFDVEQFRSTVIDVINGAADIGELAQLSWFTSSQRIMPEDVELRQGAALCFTAQQLHELGLMRKTQEQYAKDVAQILQTL